MLKKAKEKTLLELYKTKLNINNNKNNANNEKSDIMHNDRGVISSTANQLQPLQQFSLRGNQLCGSMLIGNYNVSSFAIEFRFNAGKYIANLCVSYKFFFFLNI